LENCNLLIFGDRQEVSPQVRVQVGIASGKEAIMVEGGTGDFL